MNLKSEICQVQEYKDGPLKKRLQKFLKKKKSTKMDLSKKRVQRFLKKKEYKDGRVPESTRSPNKPLKRKGRKTNKHPTHEQNEGPHPKPA